MPVLLRAGAGNRESLQLSPVLVGGWRPNRMGNPSKKRVEGFHVPQARLATGGLPFFFRIVSVAGPLYKKRTASSMSCRRPYPQPLVWSSDHG